MVSARRHRLVQALSPPETMSDSYGGMQNVGFRLQLLVGIGSLGLVWLTPGLGNGDRLQLTLLLVGFVVYASVANWIARRGPVLRLLTLVTDLLAVFSFAVVVPEVRPVVWVAGVLVVAFHTQAAGRTLGFALSGGIFLLGIATEWARHPGRMIWFNPVGYGLMLIALVLIIDGLSSERRRVSRRLTRLNRSLTSFVPGEDLRTTLQSAADAAREAVDAGFVAILLRDDDRLEPNALSGTFNDSGLDGEAATRKALAEPDRSPSGVALATGQPVLITDIAADERFVDWAGVAAVVGFRSMVSIPLGSQEQWIGTLNAYGPAADAFDDEDVSVLAPYAGQVSVVIARTLAFERERAAASELQEAERLKSDFVATVSHELRTPLTAVSGFVDTVLRRWDDLDDTTKRELLERAAWNAGELRRLVEQVLEFSTLSAEARDLVLIPHRLAATVQELVENMEPVLRDHAVDIDVDREIVVLADDQALQRILGNLLNNAAKYSPAGTRVRVTAERGPAKVTVSVADEGPGIPESDKEKIFERFYRVDKTGRIRGTGIGLTVVRTYVERLGGKVWATSEPGKGATFSFTLPLAEGPVLRPR